MRHARAHLLRIFLAGLLAALPLAATVGFFWWAASVLISWLGPSSAVGGVLEAIGLGVTGSGVVGYLIGVGIVACAVFGLGLLVEAGLQRGAAAVMQAVLRRIPLVNSVYGLAQKMVGLFQQRDDAGHRSMRAVWCHFGGPGGAAVLALLSTPKPVEVNGRRCLAVLVPTAPVPLGGGLLFVPEEWVTPAALGIEALTSIYVSMGVSAPQHLPVPRPVAAQPASSDA